MAKRKVLISLLLYGIILAFGLAAGAALQRYVGLGNVIRSVGGAYPTRTPTARAVAPTGFTIPAADQGRLALFILVGQSNMVGLAPVPEDAASDPRVYLFGNDYRWRVASEPVDSESGQVDLVSLDGAGFGPSLPFALSLLERDPDLAIGLIPCAKSSSSIIQWQRSLSDQTLYGSCLKRARAASPMGHFAGLLVFQGEADGLDPASAPRFQPNPDRWSELFTALITDMRADLQRPELPVVFAQLGTISEPDAFPYWDLIKEQQAGIRLPITAMINTEDLATYDGLHFTAESYREIGARFAEAYWSLNSR